MNVHHLELFYYVAKYEGITAAVRKMPYGIQQPAVSGQILQLEKQLGVKLFNRRPFALTPEGEELYEFSYPFFSKLGEMSGRLRGEESQHLKLAASAAVLTKHLPDLLERMRGEFPELKLTLRGAVASSIDELLLSGEVDVAVSVLHGDNAPGVKTMDLMKLPLVLVVPKSLKAKSFESLVEEVDGSDVVNQPLVGLPENEAVAQSFQRELDRRGIRWETRVEVNSLELVDAYVRNGFGLGVSVSVPGKEAGKGLKTLELTGFEPMRIGLLTMGKPKPVAMRFMEEVVLRVRELGNTG